MRVNKLAAKLTTVIKIAFSCAKRLIDYKGKCNFLHGYTHIIEAYFISENKKSSSSMVADFYELKKILSEWLEENWDHNVLLNKKDKSLGNEIEKITGQKIFYFPFDPTAENLAQYLKTDICPDLFDKIGVKCSKIRLYDSETAFVEI